ncbi:radical SAM protein [Clostridiaceae bacterium 35-E11]
MFCQNFEISFCGEGKEVTVETLAKLMLSLQRKKCHNINLVSPGHIIPQIVEALLIAAQNGLNIPIVYNSNGYDLTDTLKHLDGIIDIYLPDMKFADNKLGKKYLGVKNYYDIASSALIEMFRQVGNLEADDMNIAYKGLIIRQLVMPQNLAHSEKIMTFIAENLSLKTYVNIMAQYYPSHQSYKFKEINRGIRDEEFKYVIKVANEVGLENIRR